MPTLRGPFVVCVALMRVENVAAAAKRDGSVPLRARSSSPTTLTCADQYVGTEDAFVSDVTVRLNMVLPSPSGMGILAGLSRISYA